MLDVGFNILLPLLLAHYHYILSRVLHFICVYVYICVLMCSGANLCVWMLTPQVKLGSNFSANF